MSRLTGERKFRKSDPVSVLLTVLTLFALVMVFVVSMASCSSRVTKGAEKSGESSSEPKTFASPAAAGAALLEAAKSGDENGLLAIFGADGKEILFSGDSVKDDNLRKSFVTKYSQMNRWSKNKAGAEILFVGADNYAFPIPLEQKTPGKWSFNTAAGKDEVLARRIGDGELTAIGVLTEIANAQQEYFGQAHQYAQKIVSDDGQHNGLYWPAAQGEPSSPLGPLADVAQSLGYSRSDKAQPFNGYRYRILNQQGDTAKSGDKDSTADGDSAGGFAVVAYPATYKNSGIMTFLVGTDGVVYQKDLGDKTAETAAAITDYNPKDGWTVVLTPESTSPPVGTKTARK